ncbi:DNA polymerase III, delta subunit [Poseidonocella pacifica]|uniref:DNA-directed DNA polymerase n=1 Tax=Poseidonocella pacifica TaxID=871651 RepID=A0A1I0YL42_9RHOB|nr:DNA polymerase III subunit delta [Poseidonocella pacifica]SFB13526.1 DNA polymerase III, delta subunit [Poseidonocella pacifica]
MKLTTRDALRYFARPEPERAGLLIYGGDAMRVALRRQEVIAALIGPKGEEEMRLTRLQASDLRKDPAALSDAIKAQSFFPGPRVAFLEEATEQLAPKILPALQDWGPGDAQVIVTAGQLKPTSKLRKFFEGHRNAYAVGIYDDPPSREEIEASLRTAGLNDISSDAMADLVGLSRALDPGDFRQTLEKISLYKIGDEAPLSPEDIAACAPVSTEAAVDDLLHVVAEARIGELASVMSRLRAQGINPTSICIAGMRHFKTLYAAASDPGGASVGIGKVRPPVNGPRRNRMAQQASSWGAFKLQDALETLTDLDLKLRSAAQTAPAAELVERAMIRLAMLNRERR